MMKFLFYLLSLFYTPLLSGQSQPLFPIMQDDRVGYINERGDIILNPVYLSGNSFSEGLAAVRENGLYGFIDNTGKYIIQPSFDLADKFENGIAVVYKDGQPLFINRQGETVLPAVYKSLRFLDKRTGIITTHSNRQGIIDINSKQLIADTVFHSINNFSAGLAIVQEYTAPSEKANNRREAVIDENGKFVVPFGVYQKIRSYSDGVAVVEIKDSASKDGIANGVIDTKGNLLFKRPVENHSYITGDFHEGYARISLYKYWIPEQEGVYYSSEKGYEGFINLEGEIVVNDTNYKYVNDFSWGRTFIQQAEGGYILADRNFKQIGKGSYRYINEDGFRDGYAIVRTEDGDGVIDTMGRFVLKPGYDDIERVGAKDGFYYFSVYEGRKMYYGISGRDGKVISKAIVSGFDKAGFTNGLLSVVINEKNAWMNKAGKIVWQEKEYSASGCKPLNIDYMNRGYFYAYSSINPAAAEYSGGWAVSANTPQQIKQHRFPEHSLFVLIDTIKVDTFASRYCGYTLYVGNTTGDTVRFNAQDSRLNLKLQALDKKGNWRDIEYLPGSWCGNSYHTIKLEHGAFWTFTIPAYEGEFQTSIRAELKYIDKSDPGIQNTVYSNIVRAGINPGQFWNKRTYYPGGLMDPYND